VKISARWMESERVNAVELPRRSSAVLNSYTARYQVWGQGRPLVLVPGLAGGVSLVAPLAERLALKGFQVFAYQLRGEDDCFALRRRFGMKDLVDDLHEFLAELYLEQPLLMGVSFGGQIALSYAARAPQRLAGVIVQGVNVRFEKSLLRQVAGQVLFRFPLPANSPFINQFFNLLFGGRPASRFLADFVTRLSWQTDQSVIAHRFRLAEQTDLSDLLPALRLPVLLIKGARDLLMSEAGLDEMTQRLPHAVAKELPGAGHLAFVTHSEPIARLACEFVRRLTD
jgi:pimeloyl-ACP methyl ester carboxylesterase